MNNDVVIRAEGLGKKYVIGHESERERQTTFRDVIERTARNLARTTVDMARGRAIVSGDTMEEFWALRDVNFEIKRGEVVGIIGRNGAGKSTLLKILSRITEPSQGRVEIKGRVASLLEVGTGFHPELTGRENIYLNGAILGMTGVEIRRKFDEIVAFAEVEKFLDTPVKRYSSGMYVRLAFAVAAHLEPEILIIDEVLAVGDAEFQKKCLGKMQDVAGQGRTVLFVSHNLGAIRQLCGRAIRFEKGIVVSNDHVGEVVDRYLVSAECRSRFVADPESKAPAIQQAVLKQWGSEASRIRMDGPFEIHITLKPPMPSRFGISVVITRGDGICAHHLSDEFAPKSMSGMERICQFPANSLMIGRYQIGLAIHERNVELFEIIDGALEFEIVPPPDNTVLALAGWKGVTAPSIASWSIPSESS